jgi:hypothetical protein
LFLARGLCYWGSLGAGNGAVFWWVGLTSSLCIKEVGIGHPYTSLFNAGEGPFVPCPVGVSISVFDFPPAQERWLIRWAPPVSGFFIDSYFLMKVGV